MFVNVAAFPNSPILWYYDVELDVFEEICCTVIVQPWEIEKVDKFFVDITRMINKSIENFYLILPVAYYNEIIKKFIDTSKKYKIVNIEIISHYQQSAISALEYINGDKSDSLWVFECQFFQFLCVTWTTIDTNNLLNISQTLLQSRISCNKELTIEPLQKLLKSINIISSLSPTIVVYYCDSYDSLDVLKSIFNSYSNKIFFIDLGHAYSLKNILKIFQKQTKKEILYKLQPILGRSILLKINQSIIGLILHGIALPFQNEYKFIPRKNSIVFKVYEETTLTTSINFYAESEILIKFNIDIHGIYTFEIEQTQQYANFLTIYKPPILDKKYYRISSKLQKYDPSINAVGIDLGTADCYACVIRENGPDGVVLDPVTGHRNLPSYIDIGEINQPCGQNIINRMETYSDFTVFDAKRLLGKKVDEIVKDPLWSYDVIDYCEQIHLVFTKGEKASMIRSAEDIYIFLLKQIKGNIEEYQGKIIVDAVITAPTSYTEKQKDAIIDATNFAGLQYPFLLLESIAALIGCLYEFEVPIKSLALLFDCGDGTTDICIAKIYGTLIEVVTENGDSLLGGKEFDKILINYFGNILNHKYNIDVFSSNKKYRLMKKCREIKHNLSIEKEGMLYLDDFICNHDDVIKISIDNFEEMAADLMLQQQYLIKETLKKANLNFDNNDIVFLAGGSCRMPMIKKMLNKIFPNSQHLCSQHPEELVAKGAALHSYSLAMETEMVNERKKILLEEMNNSETGKQLPLSFL